ncbi:MAG: oligosaccharide flippase family protein [Phycisphaerae bacterium]|nr:oligosaccharide flippase family protein [Phycisphaerae bacterium]
MKKTGVKLVLRNAAVVTMSTGISQILLAITGIVLVRYLGLNLYSEYSTAALYMGLFSVLGRIGFNRVFLRECSRDIEQTESYFCATLLLNGGVTFLGLIVAFVIAYFRYDNRIFVLTLFLGTSQALIALRRMSTTVFQVHHKQHFTAIATISGALFYTVAFFLAIYLHASVFIVALLHLCMNLIAILLSYSMSFRLAFPKFDFTIFKKLIAVGKRFCVIDIMLVLYVQANGFIIAFLNLKEQVGIYNAAFRLFSVFQLIGQIIDGAISPAIYGASTEQPRMIRGLRLAMRYFVTGGIFIGVIMLARADWLMTTLFKAEFSESAGVLKLFGVAMASRFIVILLSHVIYAANKESFMVVLMTGVAIFSVIACVILVPHYGAIGAGFVFLACEVVLCVICLHQVEKILDKPELYKLLILPLLSAVVTSIFLILSNDWPIATLLLSPIVFFSVLFLTGYYKSGEIFGLVKAFIK